MPTIHYRRDNSSPLTCEQYDETLDALRDRSNHTGTQNANTIFNLKQTVEAYDYIQDLIQCCEDLKTELDELKDSIFGEGEFSVIINNLKQELLQNIEELQNLIDDLELDITALVNQVNALAQSITTISQQIVGLQNSKANINSPVFQGIPRAPQPLASSNDDQIATTAFVKSSGTPIGVIFPYAGASPPDENYLLAQGQAISRITYAGLFALLGTTYGSGDGSTTFNIPNLQTRVPVGVGSGYSLGSSGGSATHQLNENELPSHIHPNNHTHTTNEPNGGHSHAFYAFTNGSQDNSDSFQHNNTGIAGERDGDKGYITTNGGGTQIIANSSTGITINPSSTPTGPVGASQPHNNMQPYLVLNYIIKVK